MKKSNIRSFRFSDEVLGILEKFKGDSLNEKFNNLVCYCFKEVPKVEKRLKDLETEISKKQNLLSELHKRQREIDILINSLETVKRDIKSVETASSSMVKGQLSLYSAYDYDAKTGS